MLYFLFQCLDVQGEHEPALPSLIENWNKEHVKDWLIFKLRVRHEIAQNLYDQELSGACLVCYEKQDLLELGVPLAPAIQIIRHVERFRRHSETYEPNVRISRSYYEPKEGEGWKSTEMQVVSGNMDENLETETVSSDSGIQSQSSTLEILQEVRTKIRSAIDHKTSNGSHFHTETTDNATFLQLKRPMCQIRPFDSRNHSVLYIEHDILPPAAGPTNLLEPVHEYQLLPSANEASEKEILYEFTKEVCCFAASCMNS